MRRMRIILGGVVFLAVGFLLAALLPSRLFSAEPLGNPRELKGGFGEVFALAFSPDSKMVAVGETSEKLISLWDVASAAKITDLPDVEHFPNCLAFSPDGKLLASGNNQPTIQLWDVPKRTSFATLRTGARVDALAFSPDGLTLASCGGDNKIVLWDIATQKPAAALVGHNGHITSLAFRPDGKHLVSGSLDNSLIVWDVATQERITTIKAEVNAVAISPDGNTIAFGGGPNDTRVRLWNATTLQAGPDVADLKDRITSLAFSPNGKLLAAGTLNSRGQIWDLATGKAVARDLWPVVAMSPDGKWLATGYGNGEGAGWVDLRAIVSGKQ